MNPRRLSFRELLLRSRPRWVRLATGFLIGSILSLLAYAVMFEINRPYALLPPQFHYPIYYLWAIPPMMLGAKDYLAVAVSAIFWGVMVGAGAVVHGETQRPLPENPYQPPQEAAERSEILPPSWRAVGGFVLGTFVYAVLFALALGIVAFLLDNALRDPGT